MKRSVLNEVVSILFVIIYFRRLNFFPMYIYGCWPENRVCVHVRAAIFQQLNLDSRALFVAVGC